MGVAGRQNEARRSKGKLEAPLRGALNSQRLKNSLRALHEAGSHRRAASRYLHARCETKQHYDHEKSDGLKVSEHGAARPLNWLVFVHGSRLVRLVS